MKWIQRLLQTWLLYRQGRSALPSNLDLLIALCVSICIIMLAISSGISIGFALMIVWCVFAYALYRQGYAVNDFLRMSWQNEKT